MQEDIAKHLEIIQSVITRMATNSFLLKGWSVTLTAALFALAAKESNLRFVLVALLPVLCFWGLDAYYLRQERLFRELYDEVRLTSGEEAKNLEPFTMSTARYAPHVHSWFRTLWSNTVIALHGIVLGAIVVVIVISHFVKRGA